MANFLSPIGGGETSGGFSAILDPGGYFGEGGALGKGGLLKPAAPQMTEEERALLKEQLVALKAQQQITAAQMHYKIDDTGKWIKMSDEEWYGQATEMERKQWDTYKKQLGRYNLALEGELPLSKGMEVQKEEEFKGLRTAGGVTGLTPETAVARDTVSAQRLDALNKRWALIKDQAQQEALGLSGGQIMQGAALTNMLPQNASQVGMTGQWSSLLDPYMEYNRAKYQAQAQGQSNLLGTAGMGLGAFAALASSRKFKKNIKVKTKKDEDKALKEVLKTKSYSYKYKKNMNLGDDEWLGAIAEEAPRSIVNKDRTAINLANKLEMTTMAIKAINRKLLEVT